MAVWWESLKVVSQPLPRAQIWRSPRKEAEASGVGDNDSKRRRLWASVPIILTGLLRKRVTPGASFRKTD